MDQVIATLIVGLLATPVAATIGYFINRKKTGVETDSAIATGANIAVEAITSVLENLRQELDETKEELANATRHLEDMRKQNSVLLAENKQLISQVAELKQIVESLR